MRSVKWFSFFSFPHSHTHSLFVSKRGTETIGVQIAEDIVESAEAQVKADFKLFWPFGEIAVLKSVVGRSRQPELLSCWV